MLVITVVLSVLEVRALFDVETTVVVSTVVLELGPLELDVWLLLLLLLLSELDVWPAEVVLCELDVWPTEVVL